MDFPKKQAQRLMPLYLLEYSEKLFENHPDPEAPWGGGGGDYTAGDGIDITNNVISVDEDVAMKTDLSDYAKLNDDTQNITANSITVTPGGGYIHTTYGASDISMSIPRTPGYTLHIPTKDGTLAVTSDIPSLSGYATEQWVQNQGYSTFSGSYNDLTDKPDFSNYYYLNNTIEYGGHRTFINERGLEYSKEYNDNKISLVSDYLGSEQWLSGKAAIVIENTNRKTAITDSIGVFDNGYNQGVIVDYDKVEVTNRIDNTSTSLKSGELYYLGLNGGFDFNLPVSKNSGTYTLATTDDIPSLTGYATEQWVQNQGYLTSAALTNYVTTTQLEDALDDYALKTDIPTDVSELNNDAGYTTQTWVENQGYSKFSGSYNDLTDKPTIGQGVLTIQVNGVKVKQFSANETAAKTANIIVPTKTSDLTNDSGFITSSAITNDLVSVDLGIIGTTGTLSDALYNALTANPEKTIAYTNSYAGNNKVQLFYDHSTAQDIYYSGVCNKTSSPGEPFKWTRYVLRIGIDTLSEIGEKHYTLQNVDTDVALKANLATVATSGDYNDLTNKPTIPDAVSGTNDGTNWTTLTIGSDTYAVGGGSTPSNMVTTDTAQTITGAKTFKGSYKITCQSTSHEGGSVAFKASSQSSSAYPIGVMEIDERLKVLKFSVNTRQGPGYKVGLQSFGNRTYTAYLPDNEDKQASIGTGDVYLPLSVNGNKASVGGDITLSATSTVTPTTTQLVFTYTDDTTETITLMTGASVTTTLS